MTAASTWDKWHRLTSKRAENNADDTPVREPTALRDARPGPRIFTRGSCHELTDGAADGKQLPVIHAPKNIANDGTHHLLHTRQAQCG